jgi:uncharacterized protein (TIGR02996 family)
VTWAFGIEPEAIMNDEDLFLRKLLEDPADDTTRLVYADWLDERSDDVSAAKSRFLRLTVQLLQPIRYTGERKRWRRELQALAATLDTGWLAAVSRLKVENCGGKRDEDRRHGRIRLLFEFVCEMRWDELAPTEDRAVRFCEGCEQEVYYCDTITDAREHAQQGHCVAVDLGIIRREYDLNPPLAIVGRPSIKTLERERERLQVDEVSRQRERRKRDDAGSP